MTLRSYLQILAERWRLIVLFVLASTGVAVLITATTERVYQADVQIFAAIINQGTGPNFQDAAFTSTQVQTFARIANSDEIVKQVRDDTHVAFSREELKSKISATAPTGQSIIELHVQDTDPNRAAVLANSAAKYFVNVVQGYYASGDDSQVPLRLKITDAASAPDTPVTPKPLLNISLGLLVGLLVGAALAVTRDILDNRIKDVDSFAKVAGRPVMGTIVDDPKAVRHPVATRAGTRNARAENFRQLRANLQFANVDQHPRIIAITSSIPTEGKTMVAMNLASTLAEAGFTVCLVDADLRRPTVAKVMGLASPVGLTSVLINQIDLDEAIQNAGSNLFVLSSGPTPPNPSEVLASSYVREIIRSLLDRVDYVVLDTAPLLPVADGSEIAALADGTLLVARHKLTTDTQVKRAISTLARVDARLMGVVLNRVPGRRGSEYGYTYYRDDATASAHARSDETPARSGRAARSDRNVSR